MLQGYYITIVFLLSFSTGQFFIYSMMMKKKKSIYREILAFYQTLCVLGAFFYYGINSWSWLYFALMILPMVYLLESIVALIGYLGAILIWQFYGQNEIIWFYMLVIFVAPFILKVISKNLYKLSGQLTAWFIAVYLLGALAVTLRNLVASALAAVVFSSYFSSLYFFDRIFYNPKSAFYLRPFSSVRTAGIVLLAQIFSFNIWGIHPKLTWELLQEYITLSILIGISFLMLRNIRKDISAVVFGGYFVFNLFSFLLTYIPLPWIPFLVSLLQSIYSVLTGIALTHEAQRDNNLLLHLGGTGIVVLQIILRAADYGLIWALPAILFAMIGYIIVNYSYFKRWNVHARNHQQK